MTSVLSKTSFSAWGTAAFLLGVSLLFCATVTASPESPVGMVDGTKKTLKLGQFTRITSTYADASEPAGTWHQNHLDTINLGISPLKHWLSIRFSVPNDATITDDTWFFGLDSANLDHIEFRHLVNGRQLRSHRVGARYPFSERDIEHREFTFHIPMHTGDHEILLAITNESYVALQPQIFEPFEWLGHITSEQLLLGVLGGILCILAIYNLCAFAVVRERVFLVFAITIAVALAWRMVDTGFASQYFYQHPDWHPIASRIFGAGLIACLLIFTREFLKPQKWAPSLNAALVTYALLVLPFAAFPLFQEFPEVGLTLFSLAPVICLIASVWAALKRVPGSKTFLFAMLFYISGFIVSLASAQGAVPINLLTAYAGDMALVALGAISSFALASRLAEEKVNKELAELEAQEKRDFLANMSHEIRTPLNAIVGFADLLSKLRLGEDERNYVRRIETASKNLLGVINDVLDYSKIEAGKLALETASIAPATLFDNMSSMFSERAHQQGVALRFDIAENVPPRVNADALRLAQILTNLLGNALKFTSTGEVVAQIRRIDDASDAESATLEFTVRDTGIGMDEAQQQRLFSPFTQADASTTREYGGTGLGLAICRQLVELMDGEISLESKPDVGSTFRFVVSLPISRTETASTKPPTTQSVSDLSGINVLLVEDNATNQLLAKTMLKKCGATCEVASNGKIAVEKLTQGHFDVVLMDCQMPIMDGYEATGLIRTKLRSDVPIVAMTANALQGDRQRCIDAGMDDYITKPLRIYDISTAVKRWAAGEDAQNVA